MPTNRSPLPEKSEALSPPTVAVVPGPKAERVKILLLDFRSGEAIDRHPDLALYLKDGATIKSAEPRISESGTPKLLVVLVLPQPE